MCTTAAKNVTTHTKADSTWLLLKTRDPVEWMRWEDEIKRFEKSEFDSCEKLIIQNPSPTEDGFYGGINEHGVAFTSTFVRTHPVQISYIRKPYIRLILEAKTAKEGVEIIESFNPRIGGNMFIADENQCFGIEGDPREYYVEEVKGSDVKVNHYTHLPYDNISFDTDPDYRNWSKVHFERASELVQDVIDVASAIKLLQDRENSDSKTAICTTSKEEPCYTHSGMVFDTKNKKVYYAQGCPNEVEFKDYGFEE